MTTKNLAKFLTGNLFNMFILGLVVLNVAPLLAPVFAHLGWNLPARSIYFIYSFFCHQIHWRSLHIFDHQCAWCTRDTFIWAGILSIALIVKFYRLKGIKWYWVLPFIIPIAIDGGIQTIATIAGYRSEEPVYVSTNFTRMLTGGFFGLGMGMWMMPVLKEQLQQTNSAHNIDPNHEH